MIRTQIQEKPSLECLARRFTERTGISMAEAIRHCNDNALGNGEGDDMDWNFSKIATAQMAL
jgi:hypothetical protein